MVGGDGRLVVGDDSRFMERDRLVGSRWQVDDFAVFNLGNLQQLNRESSKA